MLAKSILTVIVGAVAWSVQGCALPRTTVEPTPAAQQESTSSGDALFARGLYDASIRLYHEALASEMDASERARLRLFRALARLAEGEARGEREALDELRAVELEYGTFLWGRIARIYLLEVTRRDALREALMQSGAELNELSRRIDETARDLESARGRHEEDEKTLASVRDEKRKLNKQLETLQEQVRVQAERISELERELGALKQIDMRRKP